MLKQILSLIFLLVTLVSFAQDNTSSPYSLFGLGVENKIATGGSTALGNTGIAQKNIYEINNYNPANLGNIRQNSFLYEVGLHGTYSVLKTDKLNEETHNANVSHLVFAFPIQKNWGASFGLLPYTKVGYNIDIEGSIEGSTDTYLTKIIGTGGINKFYLSSGINISKKLNLGLELSFLFGSVDQESQIFSESTVYIYDANLYNGFKLKSGFQYTLPKILNTETTIGGIVELPTKLNGRQTKNSYKTISGAQIIIEEDVKNDLDNFELPFAFGFGITSKINKKITASFDFKKLLWDKTKQYQNNERYVNQSIYALGVELHPAKQNFKYWNKVKYRLGVNYNTGFLNISDKKIDSYNFSVGLGLPLGKKNKTNVNLSYSYGTEGTISNKLIQENFHKLTLNFNFVGNWFKKQKIL